MADLAYRSDLESRVQREMTRLSKEQRDRLVAYLGDPPDPANVPEEFWQDVERERRDRLAALLLLIFLIGARQHGSDDRSVAAQAAAYYAGQRASEVAAAYTRNSRERLERRAAEWRERTAAAGTDGASTGRGPGGGSTRNGFVLTGFDATPGGGSRGLPAPGSGGTSGVPSGASGAGGVAPGPSGEARGLPGRQDAIEAAGEIFAPERDESLAVTETTAAGSSGGEWAVKAGGKATAADAWETERDAKVCPICSPLQGKQRADWQWKYPSGPPAHPRCRCWIRYAEVAGNAAVDPKAVL